MQSKWYEYKTKAVNLRKKGTSIRSIEDSLGIPRSTLSGWFKGIALTHKQKQVLTLKHKQALVNARKKAVLWHNQQKTSRLESASLEAQKTLLNLLPSDRNHKMLALSFLYLGEGFKARVGTGMGNSDCKILRFFVNILRSEFNVPIEKLKCELHLRADQNSEELKKYWSDSLSIPLANFTYVVKDQRTKGKPTYAKYKGVCVVRCGYAQIQRYLMSLSEQYLQITN